MLSLSQYRALVGDDVSRTVINNIDRRSAVANRIPFLPVSAPAGGGAMAHTFNVVSSQTSAAPRALGSDYTASEAQVTPTTIVAKILGGKFEVDRATGDVGPAVAFQLNEKSAAVAYEFERQFINGNSASVASEFDGLAKQLDGTSQEYTSAITLTGVDTQAEAFAVCAALDTLLSTLDSTDGAVMLVNGATKVLLQNAARVAGYLSHSEDAFGRPVANFGSVPIIQTASGVIGTTTGVSSIYLARMAEDGVFAIAPAGVGPVRTYLPDANASNGSPVLAGACEMITAVGIRKSAAAAWASNVVIG